MTALIFLYLVRGILLPFVIAGAICALIDPTIQKLRRRGWPKWLAIWSLVLVSLNVIIALGVWLTPVVTQQVSGFRDRIDELTVQLTRPNDNANFFKRWDPAIQAQHPTTPDPFDKLLEQNKDLLGRLGLPTTKERIYNDYIEPQRPQVGKSIQRFLQGFLGVASGFVSNVLVLLFVPLLVILMLSNMEQFKRRGVTWIPPAIRANTLAIMQDIGEVFASYLRGVTIAVVGYMAFMGMLLTLLGAPYSVLLGVLFGALYLVPYLNVAISGSLLFLVTGLSGRTGDLLFSASSPWAFGAILLAIYVVCHFAFDTLVYPRFVGRAVGLDPVVSMFVIFSGGALFGLVGMIIAFPLAGAVKVILDRLIRITSTSHEGLKLPAVPLRHRT
ncbi:putative permease [Fimbriimonas ginsengisoli Gsoil 348]|uniref:Putative permease n=1 Tax=Fimbriimonas ginsengisoli Gsoil 348 TaxID=661478 RepID=A0A068NV68_FIMGI|nr:putative permease [Fimbriimonas ginsengisoli Gsoil 348]